MARERGRVGRGDAARSDFERGFQYLAETSLEAIEYLVLERPSRVMGRESTGLPEKPGRLDSLLRVRLAGERRTRRLVLDFKDRWRGQRTAAQLVTYAGSLHERHSEWPLAAVLAVEGPRPDEGWSPVVRVRNQGLRLDFRCRLACLSHLEARRFVAEAPAPALMLAGATRGITLPLMRAAVRRILREVGDASVKRNLLFFAGVFCTRTDPRSILLELQEERMKSPFVEMLKRKFRKETVKDGRREGRREGQLEILRCLIRERFGRIPARFGVWLAGMDSRGIKRLASKVLTARSLDDLLPRARRNGAGR